jgi:UDP:flavonoid glycosyltransferase YjiC (YdhE family)
MKIVFASTPALGHVNPMLGIARILVAEGHEVAAFTGSAFQDRVKKLGARFRAIPHSRIRTWWTHSRNTPN